MDPLVTVEPLDLHTGSCEPSRPFIPMNRYRGTWSLCLVSVTLLAFSARAEDLVTYPYPCVTHVHRVQSGLDAHAVIVDLACGEVDVVATRPHERDATVSTFAREYAVQIAINANFFGGSTCGLAMGDGRIWRDATDEHCTGSFAFGVDTSCTRASLFDSTGSPRSCSLSWARQVVSGKPVLLRDGAVVVDPEDPTGMYRTHPRTVVGTTAGAANLVLVVMDGRRAGVPGATSLEIIPFLEEFGVTDAVNLDGGGSSELWIGSEGGVVNRPSDRHERSVANHLGIRVTSAL